jgi:hypothetical protein
MMKERIIEELQRIESEEKVKIVYACESGSRAWGFDSADSDYDVRFFFVRTQIDYNTVFPVNYADLTLDRHHSKLISSMVREDLDYAGHDVRKALYLMSKGNPDIISWLYSPVKYLETPVSESMREQAEKFFNTQAGMYHYAHMASKNFSQYIANRGDQQVRLKKYLYVIRPLVCCYYIDSFLKPPPMIFEDCLTAVYDDLVRWNYSDAIIAIRDVIQKKKDGEEFGWGSRNPVLDRFCSNSIDYFMTHKRVTPTNGKWAELDELFNSIILSQGGPHGSYLSPCEAR